jgi:membrane protein DedA with SNARE-associated domain
MESFLLVAAIGVPVFQSNLQETLLWLFTVHPIIVYAVIIILACAEGPILSVISGTLIRLGFFPLIPIYLALMAGDLIGDVFWYFMGYRFGRNFISRFGDRFGVTENKVQKISKLFHKHKNKILFINKLTMGFGFAIATLVTAGIAKIPFKQYISINAIGQLFWTGLLIILGYFVGQAYTMIADVFGVFGKIAIVVALLAIAYALHEYKKYMTRRADLLPI